jgi:hypothetical protein
VLTQLTSASCLLLGTIALVLVQQNKSGGTAFVIAWALGAMAGLVFGGLMSRGGLFSVLASAALVGTFGTVLLVIEYDALRSILRLLPESDVAMIADILVGAAIVMVATAALCLASIPQALRYGRALREAEAEQAASSASLSMQAMHPGSPPPGASTAELVDRYSVPSLRPASGGSFGQPAAGPGGTTRPGVPAVSAVADSGAQTRPSSPAVPGGYRPLGHGAPAPGAFGAPPPGAFGAPPAGAFGAAPPAYGDPSRPHGGPPPPGHHGDPYPPPAAFGGPPPPGVYVDPHQPHIPTAASTARGWQASPARTTTTLILRPKEEERRSRRRVYFILGGLAVGLGAGVGVMVSSFAKTAPTAETQSGSATRAAAGSGTAAGSAKPAATGPAIAQGSGSAIAQGSGSVSAQGSGSAGSAAPEVATPPVAAPNVPVRSFLAAQRDAIAKADAHGLVEHIAPTAFAFGINADDIAEGRVAIEAMLARNLGDAPPDGFTVTSKYLAIGEERNHAWVAEELELSGSGMEVRKLAVTQLLVFLDGKWTTVAVKWAEPVPNAIAERRAILGTLPRPALVPNKTDGSGELDKAVRSAFGSLLSLYDARSDRDDTFNFGSAPGERWVGAAIKRRGRPTGRGKSELRLTGGARVVAGDAWDPSQQSGPWIGFAALNTDYTYKSRAATDLTQTLRMLAILIREGDTWRIVQTQFSNGGPVR